MNEGLLIALTGGMIGVVVGVIMCVMQQHFGFIGIGGDASQMSIDHYPCRPEAGDVLTVVVVVVVIGFLSGFIASRSVNPDEVTNRQ